MTTRRQSPASHGESAGRCAGPIARFDYTRANPVGPVLLAARPGVAPRRNPTKLLAQRSGPKTAALYAYTRMPIPAPGGRCMSFAHGGPSRRPLRLRAAVLAAPTPGPLPALGHGSPAGSARAALRQPPMLPPTSSLSSKRRSGLASLTPMPRRLSTSCKSSATSPTTSRLSRR
jgi:hypothetical protein